MVNTSTPHRREDSPQVDTKVEYGTQLEHISGFKERLTGTIKLSVTVDYPLGSGDKVERFRRNSHAVYEEVTRQVAELHLPNIMAGHVGASIQRFGIGALTTNYEIEDSRPSTNSVRAGNDGLIVTIDADIRVGTETDRAVLPGESIYGARVGIGNHFAQKVIDAVRHAFSGAAQTSSSSTTTTDTKGGDHSVQSRRDVFIEGQ